ncbi:MAG: iron-containing alcohol dehydrogenase [bacterium]
MRFDFVTSGRILFGCGTAREIAPAVRAFGQRIFYVSGRRPRPVEFQPAATLQVAGEPTVDLVRKGVDAARAAGCDVVVSIGGGSVLDAGKAIAALLANPGDPLDYLEVIGRGLPLSQPSVPFVAVPTTAGSGTEVTKNAVLASPEHGVKASLRSPHMLPRLAIVDPELTATMPPAVTASTGLDALTQLIEPYVSARANSMTDMFCLEGIARVAGSLRRAYVDGADMAARTDMSFATLLGGMALANAGLGAVHGFASAIGGAFRAPHGAVCAALLPHVTRINIRALRERAPDAAALDRYAKIAGILTHSPEASPEDAVTAISQICEALCITPLSTWGITAGDVASICANAARASSMNANPIPLTAAELEEALRLAL